MVITEETAENLLESIADETGLSVEELELLRSYEIRRVVARGFDQDLESIVGRTLGSIIDEERQVQAEADLRRAEEERLAAEARAREEALAAELRETLTLAVYAKSFIPSNVNAGKFDEEIGLWVTYENTSSKDIRAFRGSLRFADLFGEEIDTIRLTIQDPVAAGETGEWVGVVDYNQFDSEDVRMRNTDLADMRIEWRPSGIIFADGAQIGDNQER